MSNYKSQPGKSYPLGATYDGKGVNFALFSANAEKVELCLFDASGSQELERFAINENDNSIWHIYVPGLEPGQVYATHCSSLLASSSTSCGSLRPRRALSLMS